MSLIPKEIEAHYLQAKESERLTGNSPLGQLERVRTQAILARYLPPAPAVIVDVGGAAGIYAVPLAAQGYLVHLIDPVELHLEQARSHASSSSVSLSSITRGIASRLEMPSGSADSVLLLGPLYHLVDRTDRLQALREARRVLKKGGVLFAAAISRFASLMAAFSAGAFEDADFRAIVAADLASGQHRNPTSHIAYFTTAYFHRPDGLAAEVRDAGFRDPHVVGVEGPLWSAAHFPTVWADGMLRNQLLEFLSLVEREPSIVGASAHFLALAHNN